MISNLYAAIVRRRRERYARRPELRRRLRRPVVSGATLAARGAERSARRPELRRRLRRPVISVGNLAAGGRGKTPIVASIARELLSLGEKPAILTRGYARTGPEDGVVVVRDPDGIRADLARSGD